MNPFSREVPIDPAHAAFLIIDVQNYCARAEGRKTDYFCQSLRGTVLPNIRRLQSACRNLGVRSLIIAGIMTDQYVESAVRDACDLGYLVTLATHVRTTSSAERHHQSLNPVEDTPQVTRQHGKSRFPRRAVTDRTVSVVMRRDLNCQRRHPD